jgi:hypothetical protein
MQDTTSRHLCGHLPLRDHDRVADTFCAKCTAHGCILDNCPGHMRWPNDVPLYWSAALGCYVTAPED